MAIIAKRIAQKITINFKKQKPLKYSYNLLKYNIKTPHYSYINLSHNLYYVYLHSHFTS